MVGLANFASFVARDVTADFGLSMVVGKLMQMIVGTPGTYGWQAPGTDVPHFRSRSLPDDSLPVEALLTFFFLLLEIDTMAAHTSNSDLYVFGAMMYALLCGKYLSASKWTMTGRKLAMPSFITKWLRDLDDLLTMLEKRDNAVDGEPSPKPTNAKSTPADRLKREEALTGLSRFAYTFIKETTNPQPQKRATVPGLIQVRPRLSRSRCFPPPSSVSLVVQHG